MDAPASETCTGRAARQLSPKDQRFVPLLEADELFFRIVPNEKCLPSRLPQGIEDHGAAEAKFRSEFASVWRRSPEADRLPYRPYRR
jgi:hypothetical protein